MATLSLFVCAPAGQNADGSCVSGQGSWQSVSIQEAFDPSTLDSEELAGFFGASFTLMATLLLTVWAGKQILRAIK